LFIRKSGVFRGKKSPVTVVGESAYKHNHAVRVFIPVIFLFVEYKAFFHSSVEEVRFEDGSRLTAINRNVFSDCPNLKCMQIPQGITIIRAFAFWNFSRLKDLSFETHSELAEIGEGAFLFGPKLAPVQIPKM
jgi:hypothetical protein